MTFEEGVNRRLDLRNNLAGILGHSLVVLNPIHANDPFMILVIVGVIYIPPSKELSPSRSESSRIRRFSVELNALNCFFQTVPVQNGIGRTDERAASCAIPRPPTPSAILNWDRLQKQSIWAFMWAEEQRIGLD